jgi:putative flippase GtrA
MPSPLSKLVAGATNNTLIQLFRYTLVGGLAFVVDFGALYVLYRWLGVHYLIAAALAFLLGLATNYTISILWVFDQRTVKDPRMEFLFFGLLGAIGLGLTEATLYLLSGLCGAPVMLSKVVATGLTFFWNFVSRKLLLFSARPESAPAAVLAPSWPAASVVPVGTED